jgi:hypothetical protein
MNDRRRRIVIKPLHEKERAEPMHTTPSERLEMMWQLALDAWAFKGGPPAEQRLPRHVVNVVRGGKSE